MRGERERESKGADLLLAFLSGAEQGTERGLRELDPPIPVAVAVCDEHLSIRVKLLPVAALGAPGVDVIAEASLVDYNNSIFAVSPHDGVGLA